MQGAENCALVGGEEKGIREGCPKYQFQMTDDLVKCQFKSRTDVRLILKQPHLPGVTFDKRLAYKKQTEKV